MQLVEPVGWKWVKGRGGNKVLSYDTIISQYRHNVNRYSCTEKIFFSTPKKVQHVSNKWGSVFMGWGANRDPGLRKMEEEICVAEKDLCST